MMTCAGTIQILLQRVDKMRQTLPQEKQLDINNTQTRYKNKEVTSKFPSIFRCRVGNFGENSLKSRVDFGDASVSRIASHIGQRRNGKDIDDPKLRSGGVDVDVDTDAYTSEHSWKCPR